MLSRREFLLLCCSMASALLLASAADSPTKVSAPPDGSGMGEAQCMMDSLQFLPYIKLTPDFRPDWFHYTFDCSTKLVGDIFQIRPHMFETSSSAEVTWNGYRKNFRTPENTGISNLGSAPGSPRTISASMAFKAGMNELKVGVGCNGMGLPYPCYYEYFFTCSCNTGGPGTVTGDPQFVGLRGQNYQVHGVAGEIYNIVSDSELQYNSRFVFLDRGDCPVVDGVKQKACWSHPGSYLGELGLKTREGDKIRVVTGPAKEGFESVTVNGKELAVGSTLLLQGDMGSITRNNTHVVAVQVGNWDFEFENSDMFVNQRVRVLDARRLASHGLLGQTWRAATYPNAVKYVQGAVDDYVIRDKDIFGDNFLYNQFN